jgi:hypothetical protein
MKTCIFIVGKQGIGKSSIVRALTGCGHDGYWKVKDLDGNSIWALVLIRSVGEGKSFPPSDFPKKLEELIRMKKRFKTPKDYTDYSLVICPIRPNIRNSGTTKFILESTKKFNVKVAGIETDWNRTSIDTKKLSRLCIDNGISYISLDTSEDYNIEANKLRKAFYPK